MKIDLRTAWVDIYDIGFGTKLFVCRGREVAEPLGMTWVRASRTGQKGDEYMAEVLDCYVVRFCRRQGVMRTLMDRIVVDYPTVRTDKGTEDGLPFLKAYGFKPVRGFGWVYRKPTPRPRAGSDATRAVPVGRKPSGRVGRRKRATAGSGQNGRRRAGATA